MRTAFLGISELSIDVVRSVSDVCIPESFVHPTGKLLLKSIVGPLLLLMYATGFLIVKNKCTRNIRDILYSRIITATLLTILFSYQKIIFTTFTLLKCVTVGDSKVMFIDGHITCFSNMQYILLFIVTFIFPIYFKSLILAYKTSRRKYIT